MRYLYRFLYLSQPSSKNLSSLPQIPLLCLLAYPFLSHTGSPRYTIGKQRTECVPQSWRSCSLCRRMIAHGPFFRARKPADLRELLAWLPVEVFEAPGSVTNGGDQTANCLVLQHPRPLRCHRALWNQVNHALHVHLVSVQSGVVVYPHANKYLC